MADDRVSLAEAEVERARARMIGTARDLASQLEPRKLARGAWESAKVKGADLAEEAVDAVVKRPVMTTGLIAAVAMFLARDPIKDAARSAVGAMTSSGKKKSKSPPSKAAADDKKPAPPPARRRARSPRRAATKTEK